MPITDTKHDTLIQSIRDIMKGQILLPHTLAKLVVHQDFYETNKKSGNLVVAGGCLIMSFNAYLMLGHPLTSLLKHVEDYRIKAQTLRLEEFNYYFQLVEKVMEALKNWQETVELNQEIEALYNNETNFILYRAVEALTNEPVLILMGRTYQTPRTSYDRLWLLRCLFKFR